MGDITVINVEPLQEEVEKLEKKYNRQELELLTDMLVAHCKQNSREARLKHDAIVILDAIRHYFGYKQYFTWDLLEKSLSILNKLVLSPSRSMAPGVDCIVPGLVHTNYQAPDSSWPCLTYL